MLEWIDEIGLMYVIYITFTALIYILGKVFSNIGLLNYAETLIKEGMLFAVLIGVSYIFYYILYEYNVPPGFYDQLFGSSTGYSGTLYTMAVSYLTNITKLAQHALYYYTELEGRVMLYSSFQCSGCASGTGLSCLGNIGMVKNIYTYKQYIEPIHQTITSTKLTLEQTVRILFTFWILVSLASSPIFLALIPIAIIIRLLPGMRFVGNILFALSMAFIIILPLLAVLQAYIFNDSIQELIHTYSNKLSVDALPGYPDPISLFFAGCTVIAPYPPSISYDGNDLILNVLGYKVTDRELKITSQELFLISVFNLSAGVVGMIAFVKGVSDLLGERNSFIDLFLRII